MQTDFLDSWFVNLKIKSSGIWTQTVSATGVCHKQAGPRTLYASVSVDFAPSNEFEVVDTLDPEIASLARDRGWYDYVVFGVLDIMLTLPSTPIRNLKLTIQKIDFNEIESSQSAFRLAARDAATKALKTHFPNISEG